MAGTSLKRIVAEKIAITVVVAALGSLLVYLGSGRGAGFWLTLVGLVLVALSPVISYMIVLAKLRRESERRSREGEHG